LENKIFEECLEYYQGNIKTPFWEGLAKKHGYGEGKKAKGRIRSHFHSERKKRGIEKDDSVFVSRERQEIKGDGTVTLNDKMLNLSDEDGKDPNKVLEAAGFDSKKFDLINASFGKWEMSESGGGTKKLRSCKISARPKSGQGLSLSDIDKWFEKLKTKIKSKPYSPKQHNENSKNVLEIDLADMHIGSQSYPNDGILIEDRFKGIINDITERCKGKSFKKIYLINLGDLYHYNGVSKTTQSGTQMETNAMNFYEMFDMGLDLLIYAIDELSKISYLEVVFVHGNHDKDISYASGKALEFYYRNNKNISFDISDSLRKWKKIGKVLLGLCHGDMPKNNLVSWLNTEARSEVSSTVYSEIHAAHFHSQSVLEKDGVLVRFASSSAPQDYWHYTKGYVSSRRTTMTYLWNEEYGLKEIWYSGKI